MGLDVAKAEAAVRKIAEPFGLSVTDAALGIIRLANANMQAALERVSIERGYDPRDFSLVATGGAGALHGATLARELKLRKMIVPQAPGQFSAWGMLMTNLRHDFIRTRVCDCDTGNLESIRATFDELDREAGEQFVAEELSPERVWIERFLDLRYRGQEHTVRTPIRAEEIDGGSLDPLIERFHDLHDQAYSFRQDDPVEIVNFHVVGWGRVDKPEFAPHAIEGACRSAAEKGARPVVFEGEGSVDSRVFERGLLPIGETIEGPAVIEEPACTTIVCPSQRVTVDEFGNLVVTEVAA